MRYREISQIPLSLETGHVNHIENATGTFLEDVWHGTPHDFDQFSMSHVGSGEGYQSYGWGLYFAGEKKVAEYYRDTVGARHGKENGYLYHVTIPDDDEYLVWDNSMNAQPPRVLEKLKAGWPGGEKALSAYIKQIGQSYGQSTGRFFYEDLSEFRGQEGTSKYLLSLGIPGHKFLDQDSRHGMANTYNYVLYDDNEVTIKGRI